MSTATPGIPRPARATTTPRPALAEPGKAKVYGFPLELGTECLPPWAEMEQNIVDVNAGMIEFRLAAVPPADPLTDYAEWGRLWRWQTLVPVLAWPPWWAGSGSSTASSAAAGPAPSS